MARFFPRHISPEMEREGYNNQGRGELLGYIAQPDKHETTCRYRISTGSNPNKPDRETCTCRIGLWQEKTPSQKIVAEMRATMKRDQKPKKPKAKPKMVKRRK